MVLVLISGLLLLYLHDHVTDPAEFAKIVVQSVFALALAIVAIGQVSIYLRQADALDGQLREIKAQSVLTTEGIRLAEQSSIYANRAYVVAKIRDIGDRDELFQFRLRIENAGNTPANDVTVLYAYGLREKPPHEETEEKFVGSEKKIVVYDESFTHHERLGLVAPNGSYHVISTPQTSFQSPDDIHRFGLGEQRREHM